MSDERKTTLNAAIDNFKTWSVYLYKHVFVISCLDSM